MEFKNALFKSITAIICVAAVCFAVNTNVGKICDAKKESASIIAAANGNGGSQEQGGSSNAPAGDEETTQVGDDNTPTDENTTASAGDMSTTSAQAGGSNAKPSSSKPSSVAEIVNYYNTATGKVASKKLAFSKERNTVEKKFEAGLVLKAFKPIVYKFMGVGDEYKFTRTVAAGDDSYYKSFLASKLTAADVNDAKLTENGGNYTITISLKNGSSSVKDGKVVSAGNTALDKCGITCGQADKDYWDHKNAENFNSAVLSIEKKATINESYNNATVVAVVNASTGNLVSLKVSFDFKVNLENVKGSSGVAEASSTVIMKGFKW